MASMSITAHRTALAVLALGALWGCGGDGGTEPNGSTGPDVTEFVAAVMTSDGQTQGSVRSGSPPSAGGGPAVQATLRSATLLGGSTIVDLSGSSPFSRVIVTAAGARNYHELTLASAVTQTAIIITLPQEVESQSFALRVAGASGSGQVGAYDDVPVTVTPAGTGDIQVTVSWDAPSDVDLHVVDPSGEDVFYGNPQGTSGGLLDIDSNAGCAIDNINNENITWPTGRPPRGTYIVRVDYFDSCDVPATNYVVTVRVRGQQTRTFAGRFTGEGDFGGPGSGRQITTFTY
jgi:hypothetical protein